MAAISVTYTFANSTTADATQVNTNFNDIVNGTSDGTKDFDIGSLIVEGATTLKGNVSLGDGTPDDLTFNGSIASNIPVKTNATYNFGTSTLGMNSIYIGSSGSLTTRLLSGATGSSWSLTLPPAAPSSNGQVLTGQTDGTSAWSTVRRSPDAVQNCALSTSVGSNQMTINLLAADGSTPSSTNSVDISFKHTTAATGTPEVLSVTSSLSITIPNGATLGATANVNQYIYVWAMNNSGTVELVVSGSRFSFDEGTLNSSTAISGSATDWKTLYGASGRASKPIRLIGRVRSSQSVAGTYTSNSNEISLRSGNTWPIINSVNSDITFAPTNWGTTTNNLTSYRNANWCIIQGTFTCGTTTGSGGQLDLPSGMTIDFGAWTGTAHQFLGTGFVLTGAGAGNVFQTYGHIWYTDLSDTNSIFIAQESGSSIGQYVNRAANAIASSGDKISVNVAIPIKEWRSY